jgi:hypothetical protein
MKEHRTRMNRILKRVVVSSGFGLLAINLINCSEFGLGGLGSAACPELGSGGSVLNANFSGNAQANGKVRTFVQASKDLVNVSLQMEAEATNACKRMGQDLGIPPGQMAARPGAGGQAAGACGAVAAAIDQIFRGGVSVQVRATAPVCQANVQAEANCKGSCSAQVSPGEIVARCEPGKVAGQCQGRCTGQCDGNCNGNCNGNCTARDAQGRCIDNAKEPAMVDAVQLAIPNAKEPGKPLVVKGNSAAPAPMPNAMQVAGLTPTPAPPALQHKSR